MALNAGTIWEIRTTGSQTNGGGFYNRNPGTSVDYSQQDAAQLSLSDIATDVAGTTLTSATGGFTAAMAGNIIYLTGGGATAGWYEIVTYTDTNNVVIDRTAGSSKSNVTGNVGGAFLLGGTLDDDFLSAQVAGNTIWVKAGSYTAGENISPSASGTIATVTFFLGYNASRGDKPTGANRPLIDFGAYYMYTNNFWYTAHLRFTGTAAQVYLLGTSNIIRNCYASNTSGTASRSAFYNTSAGIQYIECEAVSTNGYAFRGVTEGSQFVFCYAHDSSTGFEAGDTYIGCFADTCTTGFNASPTVTRTYMNCVAYGCTTGINSAGSFATTINCIVDGNTTGISYTATYSVQPELTIHNCLDNTTNYNNGSAGADDVVADPKLNDPANGDFSLQSGSPCFDAGLQPTTKIGIT